MLWTYEDEDFNGSVSMEVNSDDIEYDAEYMNIFVEQLTDDVKWYMERAHELEKSYVKYHNNETFVGEMAERSKSFLYEVQGDVLHIKNIELKKDFLYACSNIEEKFKEQVDPAPNARLSTRVLLKIKKDFGTYYAVIDTKGYEIECHAKRLVDMYSKWGISTIPYYRRSMMAFEEFCGNGEFLDTCIKKLENFDQDSCSALNGKDFIGNAQALQTKINNVAGNLDSMTVYQPNMTKKAVELVALNVFGVKATSTTKNVQKTSIKRNNANAVKQQNSDWLVAMKDQYGFTEKELKLIADSYAKFDIWIKKTEYNELVSYTNKEKIQIFFGYLSALNPGYSSSNPTFNSVNATSTENAIYNLKEMGIEAEALQKALLRQHSICADQKKRDFVHECAMYSLMPSSALNTASKLIKKDDLSDLIGFKGDVYSASMNEDDMKSDIAAVNIYNRMVDCQDGNIFNAMTDYCAEEKNGKINVADEFLKNYGDGDPDKGMEVIKRKLDNKTKGAKSLQGNKSDQDVENTKRQFLEYLEKERSK